MSLICKDIVKTYSGKDVLQDVSLELQPGKIYGLIGRNGAGKTTLLSILTAQNPATRGEISLDGQGCGRTGGAWRSCAFPGS